MYKSERNRKKANAKRNKNNPMAKRVKSVVQYEPVFDKGVPVGQKAIFPKYLNPKFVDVKGKKKGWLKG